MVGLIEEGKTQKVQRVEQTRLFDVYGFSRRESMSNVNFKLKARVSSSNPLAIQPALERLITKGSITKDGDEFLVEAEMEGTNAKELNRSLLSELRKVEKKTRLGAEWTSASNTTEDFFDYVLKFSPSL